MIDIRDTSGKIRFSTPVNAGSKRKFLLMKEDYITLKFSLDQHVYFRLGDYVDDPRFGLFELCDLYKPTFNNSNGGYDYELRLDAYYWKWKNKIFKFTPETGGQEASWNLTASLDVQLGIFLRNLQALGYTYKGTNFEFSIDKTVENSAKLMSYDSVNLLDALSRLAEAWGCEWWMEDSMIRFGRCEFGDPVDFELGKNVETMDRSESQNSYATRIYAFGSTRNLPVNYRPASSNLVQNGVVQKRLMLPVGTPYIDAQTNMATVEAIEDVVIFEDVYPRRVATMADVVAREVTIESKEGEEPTEKVVTVYRFKDNGITFSNEYILAGQDLKITFQSGSLNGMTFSVLFDPNEKDEQLWEIVRNSDYSGEGRELPDKDLHPKDGDEFVLSGWDPTKITDLGLVASAEKELKAKAEKYVAKTRIDPSTYNNKMMSDSMVNEDGTLRLFELGDKVNLINPHFFEAGNRQSRVIGFEYNLDYPNDSPVYTVGETASYSRIGELESKLDSLTFNGQTYTGNGGNGVYVIGTNDSTPATNRNVLSALRSLSEFVSKKKDDIVQGVITFLKGLKVGKFVPGWIGTGAAITVDPKTGKTRLEVDEVLARERFETMEFRFNRIDVIDGEQWSTFAFGKIKSVDTESRIVYLDLVEGELMSSHVNDICRGIFHNLTAANAAGNKMDDCGFYTQAGFSTSYFTPTEILPDGSGFKYALRPGTTQHPCAEMKFAAYGNFSDKTRQSTTYSTRTRLIMLQGVDTWNIDPEKHYIYVRGELDGLEISGVKFEGSGTIQGNSYIYGSTIKFTKEQMDELKGESGYSVMLSSYDAIVNVDEFGRVDSSVYDIINVVNGEELVYSDDSEVTVTKYKIFTEIRAAKGNTVLEYSDTPVERKYVVTYEATGCECTVQEGRVTITKITEDKANVKLHINCEGIATFDQYFYTTRIYSGAAACSVNLTSDTDAIACDSSGAPYGTGVLATSTAELYFANERQTQGVLYRFTASGCIITESQNVTGIINVTGISQDKAYVYVTVDFKGKTFNLTYSLIKVFGTAIYKLVPSADKISKVYNKDTKVYVVSPSQISCGVAKSEKDQVTGLDSLPGGYYMRVNGQPYKLGQTIAVDGSQSIRFELYNVGEELIDAEVIPVLTGEKGEDGVSITNADVLYGKNQSTTVPPTEWQTESPAWQEGYYIWSKTKIVYSNGKETYTDPVCITGGTGHTGIGVKSITEYYYLSTSNTQLSGGSWQTSYPGYVSGRYLWTSTKIEYTDGSYEWTNEICVSGPQGNPGESGNDGSPGHDGSDGTDGDDAISYWLVPSVTQIGKNSLGALQPSSFTVTCKEKSGNSYIYNSYFYIAIFKSVDGGTWVKESVNYANQVTVTPSVTYKYYTIRAYQSSGSSNWSDVPVCTVSVNVIEDGKDAVNEASSSFARNRGEWSSSNSYLWNADWRDYVYKYSGAEIQVWVVNVFNKTVTSTPSTSNSDWKKADKNDVSAFNLVLADGANIAGFIYKNGVMKSQNENMEISGKQNNAYIKLGGGKTTMFEDGSVNAASGNVMWDVMGNVFMQNIIFRTKTWILDYGKVFGESSWSNLEPQSTNGFIFFLPEGEYINGIYYSKGQGVIWNNTLRLWEIFPGLTFTKDTYGGSTIYNINILLNPLKCPKLELILSGGRICHIQMPTDYASYEGCTVEIDCTQSADAVTATVDTASYSRSNSLLLGRNAAKGGYKLKCTTKGWIVEGKFQASTTDVLMKGYVIHSGTSSYICAFLESVYNISSSNVSVSRISTAKSRVYIPSPMQGRYSGACSDILLTGISHGGGVPTKATHGTYYYGGNYFDVYVSDDYNFDYDGDYSFVVYAKGDLYLG